MKKVCYLCGKNIENYQILSSDHVVPKQFIDRPQPKIKGFDYAGQLPTHEECNNRFGPETYAKKAISIISALHNNNCTLKVSHPKDSSLKIIALNPLCFPDFTQRDIDFFELVDIRDRENSDNLIPDLDFFKTQPKVNLKKKSSFIALSVLAKSSAALLVSRHLNKVPEYWKIYAMPYISANADILDKVFGDKKPFEIGIKCWIAKLEDGDFFVAYQAQDILVFFFYIFTDEDSQDTINYIQEILINPKILLFEGSTLFELSNYEWREI